MKSLLLIGITLGLALTSMAMAQTAVHTVPYVPVSQPAEGPSDPGTNSTAGWTTLFSDDFSSMSPQWQRSVNSGYTNAYWGRVMYRPENPSLGWQPMAWCAAEGSAGRAPGNTYPANMSGWMFVGPFDLRDARNAMLTFRYWNESESGYDYLRWLASSDGTSYYGYEVSGNSQGWQTVQFDLSNVPTLGDLRGSGQVWIGFRFFSDLTNQFRGAFIDDVVLQKEVGAADLAPISLSLDPDPGAYYWKSGCTTVQGQYIERNSGASSAVGHYSEIYLTDGVRRYSLATVHVPLIPGGSDSPSVPFTATVPAGIPDGEYYIYAEADMNGSVGEEDESNNTARYSATDLASVRRPAELFAESIDPVTTWNWRAGERQSVTLEVGNTGAGYAPRHRSRIVLSHDRSTVDAILGDVEFVNGIPAYSTASAQLLNFTVPQLPAGNYYIGAIVDVEEDVLECDNDNTGYTTTAVVRIEGVKADLVVTELQTTSPWTSGASVNVTVRERNLGMGTAAVHTTHLYLSTNASSNDHFLAAETFAAIPSGADAPPKQFTFTVSANIPTGNYYLVAVADATGAVDEENRTNNRLVYPAQITVTRSLAVIAPASGDAWQVGTLQEIRWTSSGAQCVGIDLSTNNGSSWSTIVSSFSTNTGVFPWTVPNLPSTQCRVRVRDCGNSAIAAESGMFTIVQPQGRLTLLQSSIAFGTVDIGKSKQASMTIRNDGNGNLTVGIPAIAGKDGGDFRIVGGQNMTILPGASGTITVEFVPNFPEGEKQAVMTFTTSDPQHTQATITLSGTAQGDNGGIVLQSLSLNFGVVNVGDVATRILYVINTSRSPVLLSAFRIEGTYRGLFDCELKTSNPIPAGGTAMIQVTFRPTGSGMRTAQLCFNTSDPKTPQASVPLEGDGTTAVSDAPAHPVDLMLHPNYPNPFHGSTTLRFSVRRRMPVQLYMYDATGALQATVDAGVRDAGDHAVVWNAEGLPAGLYHCRIVAGGQQATRTLIHLR